MLLSNALVRLRCLALMAKMAFISGACSTARHGTTTANVRSWSQRSNHLADSSIKYRNRQASIRSWSGHAGRTAGSRL